MGIPEYLTYLLQNLYVAKEATVRTRYGTIDGLKIGKGVHKVCIMSPCLCNKASCMYVCMYVPSWINHKLVSRLQGKISITSDMQMKTP